MSLPEPTSRWSPKDKKIIVSDVRGSNRAPAPRRQKGHVPFYAWVENAAQVEFGVHGNPVLPDRRNGRLQLTSIVDGPGSHLDQPKTAPQIETQRRQFVIGCRQPEPLATSDTELGGQRFNQSGSYSGAGWHSVERDQLRFTTVQTIGSESLAVLGDQRRQRGGVDDLAVHDNHGGAPSLAQEAADPCGVRGLGGSDR